MPSPTQKKESKRLTKEEVNLLEYGAQPKPQQVRPLRQQLLVVVVGLLLR